MKEKGLSQLILGESSHYKGTSGSKYCEWQNRNRTITGRIEARKFKAYVKPADSVLDFGCGGGHVLRNLDCARRMGIEMNPSAGVGTAEVGIDLAHWSSSRICI